MTMQPGWVPPGVDTGKANSARVYDWWLGGDHNFRADQDAARAMIAIEPNAPSPPGYVLQANRSEIDLLAFEELARAGLAQCQRL